MKRPLVRFSQIFDNIHLTQDKMSQKLTFCVGLGEVVENLRKWVKITRQWTTQILTKRDTVDQKKFLIFF